MQEWHAEFEKMSPDAHQDFLESLGIAPGVNYLDPPILKAASYRG